MQNKTLVVLDGFCGGGGMNLGAGEKTGSSVIG
jgi:hypothetical protein